MILPKRFDIFPPNWGMLRKSRCVHIFLLKTATVHNNNSGCGKSEMDINWSRPVAPVAQLVTSKPSDTLGREYKSR